MQFTLTCHRATSPSDSAMRVWASVDHVASFGVVATTNIWFGVGAPAARFVMPASDNPGRADGLWQTTCCEVFLRASGDTSYREWNFSPSGAWAAYDFSAYRDGMAEAEIGAPPYIRVEDNLTWWALGATIAVDAEPEWELGLSLVLEEKDGTKSYWALAHPPGDKPDFHASDCFAARLA